MIRFALACVAIVVLAIIKTAFALLLLSALAGCGGFETSATKGPHWWNCKNIVCHQVASRVDEAVYVRSTHECQCWIEDARFMPQWIVVKP